MRAESRIKWKVYRKVTQVLFDVIESKDIVGDTSVQIGEVRNLIEQEILDDIYPLRVSE